MKLQATVDRGLRTVLSAGVAVLPIAVSRGWLTAQDATDIGVLVAAVSASWHGSQYVTNKGVNDTVNTLASAAIWARSAAQPSPAQLPGVLATMSQLGGTDTAPKAEQHQPTEGNQP